MNIYDPKRFCPKCGCSDVTTKYNASGITKMSRGDVLRRVCQRCDFAWYELPLSQDASA